VGDGFIFWANSDSDTGTTIGRARINGTEVTQTFIKGANGPCGVALG
jgi:hypothetical protein